MSMGLCIHFDECFKFAELALVQALGYVKDKHTFSIVKFLEWELATSLAKIGLHVLAFFSKKITYTYSNHSLLTWSMASGMLSGNSNQIVS